MHSLDDIENQKAARIAKQIDPEGLRTIGEAKVYPLIHNITLRLFDLQVL